MSMATKPGRIVTYNEELLSIKSKVSLICYIFSTTMTMATILDKVVLYN